VGCYLFANGAGIGGGYSNTQKLGDMKYHKKIKRPDGKLWKAEVAKEHHRMIDSGVFEPVKLSKVPKGVKLINATWAMKKKVGALLEGG
jgi:hypothetical protein